MGFSTHHLLDYSHCLIPLLIQWFLTSSRVSWSFACLFKPLRFIGLPCLKSRKDPSVEWESSDIDLNFWDRFCRRRICFISSPIPTGKWCYYPLVNIVVVGSTASWDISFWWSLNIFNFSQFYATSVASWVASSISSVSLERRIAGLCQMVALFGYSVPRMLWYCGRSCGVGIDDLPHSYRVTERVGAYYTRNCKSSNDWTRPCKINGWDPFPFESLFFH